MECNLIFAQGKIVEDASFGKAVWLKVVPRLITQIAFIKINMENTYLRIGLIHHSCRFLFYRGHLKVFQHAFGKHVAN